MLNVPNAIGVILHNSIDSLAMEFVLENVHQPNIKTSYSKHAQTVTFHRFHLALIVQLKQPHVQVLLEDQN